MNLYTGVYGSNQYWKDFELAGLEVGITEC